MQIIGILLIIAVVALLVYYFKWSKTEAFAEGTGAGGQKITVVVSGAYSPNVIHAKLGQPLTIIFDRKEDTECSKKVIFSDFGVSTDLADFGKTEVIIIPDKVGEFTFSCAMGMYQGKLVVEE